MKSPYPAATQEQSEINLAPMLDIVFIMLIFFVVTASFIKELGVPVDMPPKSLDLPQNVEAIVVIVEPGGLFNVNGRLLSKDNLQAYVQALVSENPEATYSVLVERTARVGDTVIAVDAGRMIGLDVVPIARVE